MTHQPKNTYIMSGRVALIGTPNVGKSTLFNALTGLNQKVGNFPGVTVEPWLGTVRYNTEECVLIDLPGIYGFESTSEDERLSVDVLRGLHPKIEQPVAILFVLDATAPEKSLALFSAISTLGIPVQIVATMVDSVKATGGHFDDITLQHETGVTVHSVVGSKGLGIREVQDALFDIKQWKTPRASLTIQSSVDEHIHWGLSIAEKIIVQGEHSAFSEKLDSILLHPVWGSIIFCVIMLLFFQSIFTWAQPLMDGIDAGFSMLQDIVYSKLPDGLLRSFLTKGVIGGVGSVLVFLPQIIILNICISVLEECGYLARAAFLVDRAMGIFGLQGRSFIPLLGSFACAIPGIMSARIIPSYRDRMATIMAAPLMACSARLPVYTLLIGAVIPATAVWGYFSVQGLVLSGLYVLGAVSGLLIALALKKTMFKGAMVPFLMEFPVYRAPSIKNLWLTVISRSRDFVQTAGTVILGFSIVLWLLTELPQTQTIPGATQLQKEQQQMEHSVAATIGKSIQPVFAPLGFDWRLTLGVLSSYAARETFVSAMGQIYAADVQESDASLRGVLQQKLSLPVGLSLLAFYVYALQCISTMAIMKRETGSWKWPAIAFGVTLVLAYIASLLVFNISLILS